jgi:recombination associated protein RdgC
MWFKQLQLFQLDGNIPATADQLQNLLDPLLFKPCPPSVPQTAGWVAPIEQLADKLAIELNGNLLFCLQTEEKLLPTTVIRHHLAEKIEEIETEHGRTVRYREKRNLQEEIIHTLLPRAFSKYAKVYAYIDTKNKRLLINSTTNSKIEPLMSLLKRALENTDITAYDLKKPAGVLTRWVHKNEYPKTFSINKKAVLQDPDHQQRVIRCQNQDLFASSIQALLSDGCEIQQLALNWQDRVEFTLTSDFYLNGIKYGEELLNVAKEDGAETAEQQFLTDFMLMSETLAQLLEDLMRAFVKKNTAKAEAVAVE